MAKTSGTIKFKGYEFCWMTGNDGEVWGGLYNTDRKLVESGWYRTNDPDKAIEVALSNQGVQYLKQVLVKAELVKKAFTELSLGPNLGMPHDEVIRISADQYNELADTDTVDLIYLIRQLIDDVVEQYEPDDTDPAGGGGLESHR